MAKRKIAGKRGIVTGASGGIGLAIARELAAQGARLVLVARRRERLLQVAADISGSEGQIYIVAGDVTDPAVRQQAIDEAQAKFGGLDLLVNNAGLGAIGRFEASTAENLRRIMEVNFFAAAEMIRAALPALKRGEQPLIVNVASILGHRGIPQMSEYCASKFALRGLSQSLRAELAPLGIGVLVVSPGTTETEFFEHIIDPAQPSPWTRARGMSPATVASAAVRAMRRGQSEIVLDPRGRMLVWMDRLMPRVVDRILTRYG